MVDIVQPGDDEAFVSPKPDDGEFSPENMPEDPPTDDPAGEPVDDPSSTPADQPEPPQ